VPHAPLPSPSWNRMLRFRLVRLRLMALGQFDVNGGGGGARAALSRCAPCERPPRVLPRRRGWAGAQSPPPPLGILLAAPFMLAKRAISAARMAVKGGPCSGRAPPRPPGAPPRAPIHRHTQGATRRTEFPFCSCAERIRRTKGVSISRSPNNPALQQLRKSSKSASTTWQRPIWNSFATVGVRDFWENGCTYSRSPKNPALQLLQNSSKSASAGS